MHTVEVSVVIKKPKNEVYRIIKNIEEFPVFIAGIHNLKIIGRKGDLFITAWDVEIDGAPVSWKEEDYFDDANCKLAFNMIEGSYQEYKGEWLVQDSPKGAKLTIKANFEWGIPVLEKYVGRVLKDKARRGLLGMIQAIKNRLEE